MSKRSSRLTFSVIFEDENEDESEDPFNEDQQDGALEIGLSSHQYLVNQNLPLAGAHKTL